MKRKCYCCGESKEIELFAKDKTKYLGYSYRCLSCVKIKNKEYRLSHRDYFKSYIRSYYRKNPERFAGNKEKYRGRYKKDLVKNRARNRLEYAVKRGLVKKLPCFVCGDVKSEAHHQDYQKPLDVMWLCKKHHGEMR